MVRRPPRLKLLYSSAASDGFKRQVLVTDADLERYYRDNSVRFRSVENADVEFLVLDLPYLQSRIELPEQDLKTYYEQNLQRLSGQEQRRASHILVNAAKDLPEADKAKARAKAEELLAVVRKAPKSFADVARKNSDDTGSAQNGGDRDFFARGALVQPFYNRALPRKRGQNTAHVTVPLYHND